MYDLAQTFYIDRNSVQAAEQIFITSVDLYFYSKPVAGKTKTGINKPGVTVNFCTTSTEKMPNIRGAVTEHAARVEYDNINTSNDGSVSTTFTFPFPISVGTDQSYGLLIKFDGSDDDFKLWYNKAGQNKLGTTTKTQVSSGKVDGNFFIITNGISLTPLQDADLSFRLRVAKFTTLSNTYKIRNRAYELLKVKDQTSTFKVGEEVYFAGANATGTVTVSTSSKTITGSGTSFSSVLTVGDKFVVTDGTLGNTDIRTVVNIANTTSMTVDITPSFSTVTGGYYKTLVGKVSEADAIADFVILQDINTSGSLAIAAGTRFYGVDSLASANVSSVSNYALNSIIPNFNVSTPSGTTLDTVVNVANTSYNTSSSRKVKLPRGKRHFLNRHPHFFASRTNEANTTLTGGSSTFRSIESELTFTTTNPYTSPIVDEDDLDFFAERFDINNDDTNEYKGLGNSKARYVSRVITLAGQRAEDLKAYVRAFRPFGSTIKVYARLRNADDPETIDVKDWTELQLESVDTNYSNPANINERVELAYGIPSYRTGTTASGAFTTVSGNTVITGTSGNVNTDISIGNVVRVYSPYIADSFFIDTVTAANTTTFTVSQPVSNSSLVGTGWTVDVIDRPNSAFLDKQNQEIVTYYNQSLSKYVGYDSFTIKIVLLSTDAVNVPFVDDVRAIAVSA